MNDVYYQRNSARRGDRVAGPLLLGIDLGTSSLKCGLFDLEGRRVAASRVPIALRPAASGGEQDAGEWWDSLVKSVELLIAQDVRSSSIAAIAVGGHAPSPVFVDKDLRAVSPVVPWLDHRARSYVDQVVEKLGRVPANGPERLMLQLASRAMWMRDNAPDKYAKVDCVLHSGDYLVARLTGERVSSSPILPEFFEAADLPVSMLSKTASESYSFVSPILDDVAERLGLEKRVPVVAAGLDSFLASVGSGACDVGDACLMTGSSAGVALVATAGCRGRFQWGECQALSRQAVVGGRALDWVHQAASSSIAFSELLAAGAGGRRPALSRNHLTELINRGQRGDAFVRELMCERIEQNDVIDVLRTVMDAIIVSQRELLFQMEREGGPARRLRAVGGLAASSEFVQLQADIIGRPVEVPAVIESGTLGAAMCAAVALGYGSPREISRMARTTAVFHPRSEPAADYPVFETERSLR